MRPTAASTSIAGRVGGYVLAIPRVIARLMFHGLDYAYLLAQVVVRSYGFGTLARASPETVRPGGLRVAEFPDAPPLWPAIVAPLPPGAVPKFTAESMLQRSAAWATPGPIGDVEAFVDTHIGDVAGVEVRKGRESGQVRYYYAVAATAPCVLSMVNVAVGEMGEVVIAVVQRRDPPRRFLRKVATALPLSGEACHGVAALPPPFIPDRDVGSRA